MENRKVELNAKKAELNAKLNDQRKQAGEMSEGAPRQVAEKLRENAALCPSRYDFDSDHEWKYRLDVNDNSGYPEAAKLIEDMRQTRQAIHNLEFEEEQGGPKDTMTC
jgi:hypothetical protein